MGEADAVGQIRARRHFIDRLTKWVIGFGGAAVIGAITLIFAYLLWVVAPLLAPGSIGEPTSFKVVERSPVLVDISENGEVALRIDAEGIVEFYDAVSGRPVAGFNLGRQVAQAQRVYPTVDVYALLNPAGELTFIRAAYTVSFADGERKLTPSIEFPFGNSSIAMPDSKVFDAQLFDGELLLAYAEGKQYKLNRFRNVTIGFPLGTPQTAEMALAFEPKYIFTGPRNEWTYVIDASGQTGMYSLSGGRIVTRGTADIGLPYSTEEATTEKTAPTSVAALLGRYSLVTASASGITQWGVFNEAEGMVIKPMRSFAVKHEVSAFVTEPRRKGFASIGNGSFALHYPTSGRTIDEVALNASLAGPIAISPRSNAVITASSGSEILSVPLDNKHPEISFATLWQKIWYEGYEEPIFSWQSSSADNDFEPKFSLTPLAFGTLKAAFYALLFAVPLAIMGAIYTAYFMSPAMRAWVKPGIEIMAALPTVILGFIGGLWLAPIIEANLSSILGIFVVLPVGLFLFALIWSQLPDKIAKPFAGWYGLIVVPLIIITVWAAFDVGPWLESSLFGGDSKAWFREVLGLNYDQRNALVVGIIMGLAVIPVIFTIAEDAIYGVPTHLINGSLALGATPWQTLVRVVLLTASPGIFSAVMIGMGRAVGETMIVLMATGNTPLMDFNIFEGMRTFAANIAVELPESEVGSSHYRILFLAALVLFMLTFVVNTLAEVVRQRLRARYGSL